MELTDILNNIRSLRAQLRGVDTSTLSKMLSNLNTVYEEHLQEDEEARKAEEARTANLREAKKMIEELGVDPQAFADFLNGIEPRKSRKGTKMLPKYRYPDPDTDIDTEYEWSGQGKMPKKFEELLAKTGQDKEFYRIED